MIRPGRLADIHNTDVLEFIKRGMSLSRVPLTFDEGKFLASIEEVVNNHYSALSEEGGKVSAAIGAVVHEMAWFEGKQASVILLRSEKNGEGLCLLKGFLDWCRDQEIRMAYINYSPFAGKRHGKAMQRLGLCVPVESYALYL